MPTWFAALIDLPRQFLGLVVPLFAKAGDWKRFGPVVRSVLSVILTVAVPVGLFFLQRRIGSFNRLLALRVPVWLQPYYLAALGTLVIALAWLAWWFIKLLGEEDEAAEFPDIDRAWREALDRLSGEGIALSDVPVYLVVGETAAGFDAFFAAAQAGVTVVSPREPDAPVRVFAHRDAAYVVAPGASLVARTARVLNGLDDAGDAEPIVAAGGDAADISKTIGGDMGGALNMTPEIEAEFKDLLKIAPDQQTPEQAARLKALANAPAAPARRKAALDEETRTRLLRRMQFLCRLIRRERQPWCPVNGMMLLVPWAATRDEDAAKEFASAVQRELTRTREALALRCPVGAVQCDLETAAGFAEYRGLFAGTQLKQRHGQGLPLVPDVKPSELPDLYERAANWIGQGVLPSHLFKGLTANHDARTPLSGPGPNRNLYLLYQEIVLRGNRLGRLLARALQFGGEGADPADAQPLLWGCYVAGTGAKPEQQAFVPGQIPKLNDFQDMVSWTGQALAEDARYRRLAQAGYVAITVTVVALAGVAAWWLTRRGPQGSGGLFS